MKNTFTGIGLCLLTWLFLWLEIDRPKTLVFDENHYVPAARTFLLGEPPINLEHPPLAKMIMAQGMRLIGDNAEGWRFMSTLFGALTVGGIFFWAMLLFKSLPLSILTVFLTLSNQLFYVQSRLALLEPFQICFLIWSLAFFSAWWKEKKTWTLVLSGVLGGLAMACKWSAFFPLATLGILLLTKKKFKPISLFTLPLVLSYAATFYTYAQRGGWGEFFSWQLRSYELQKQVPPFHGYASAWWSWPLQLRPIWYDYLSGEGGQTFQGIFLVGNPLILWGGCLVMLWCLWDAVIKKNLRAREISLAYFILYLSWTLIPRELMFFYYYYSAALILGFGWVHLVERIGPKFRFAGISLSLISLACFLYFYPVLSSLPRPIGQLRQWLWFDRWI